MAAKEAGSTEFELPECHFKWKPEINGTKKLETVLKVGLEKLTEDPLNTVAYYTLLAYIYAQPETVNFREAEKCLESAEKFCAQIQDGHLSSDYLSCQFVIDANRVCLHRERRQNISQLPDKFQELQTRWAQMKDQSKAAVFAVKAIALLRFGLTKYPEAVQCYAEANRLSLGRNYHYLYGEAMILARIRRSESLLKPPTDHESGLWREAHRLSICASKEFDRANLLVLYAQTLLNSGQLELCLSLTDEAWSSMKDLPHCELVNRISVLMLCAKCYRIVKKIDQDQRDRQVCTLDVDAIDKKIIEVVECLLRMKDQMPKRQLANFLFLSARDLCTLGKLSQSRSLLEQVREISGWPGYMYAECLLMDVKRLIRKKQFEAYTTEDCLAEYDGLIAKFNACSGDVALIMLHKADFQVEEKMITDAVQTMTEADETDPNCWKRIGPEKLLNMFREMQKSLPKEHCIWYLEKTRQQMRKITKSEVELPDEPIQILYESVLIEDPGNLFTLQQLGKLHLTESRACAAEDCFRKLLSLSPSIQAKKLLAESILHSDCQQKLKECCGLGCKDACERLLGKLMKEKGDPQTQATDWTQEADRYQRLETQMPCERPFSREAYEVCALVHNLVEGSSGYFIHQPSDVKIYEEKILSMIDQFLEISTSEDGVPGQGNALRKSRFAATKLVISGNQVSSPNFDVEVRKTRKEAKESLDRATTLLPSNYPSDYFVHGFEGLRKEADITHSRMSKVKGSRGKDNNEIRKQAEQNLVDYIQKKDHKELHSSISAYLTGKLTKQFSTDPRTKEIFEFLVSRESAILSAEGPWLVRWIYGANREKHVRLQKFEELDEQLGTEFKGRGPKTAYEMAHRAAEFAEETRLVMSSWRATDEARETGNATGETSGGNEATGVTDETDDCIGQLFE